MQSRRSADNMSSGGISQIRRHLLLNFSAVHLRAAASSLGRGSDKMDLEALEPRLAWLPGSERARSLGNPELYCQPLPLNQSLSSHTLCTTNLTPTEQRRQYVVRWNITNSSPLAAELFGCAFARSCILSRARLRQDGPGSPGATARLAAWLRKSPLTWQS